MLDLMPVRNGSGRTIFGTWDMDFALGETRAYETRLNIQWRLHKDFSEQLA